MKQFDLVVGNIAAQWLQQPIAQILFIVPQLDNKRQKTILRNLAIGEQYTNPCNCSNTTITRTA